MLEFHQISLDDRQWCREIEAAENSRSSDFGFASMYMWDGRYKQKLARLDDRMIVKLRYEELPFFAFPIGSGPIRPAVRAIKEYADFRGWPLRISGITDENRALMEAEFPGCFVYCDDVSFFDYMYRTESLATLAGKKLHGKKNHCNRFEAENPDWEFVPLTPELIPGCLEMLEEWTRNNADRLHDGIDDEHEAILRGFVAFEALGLVGGVLRAGGRILGFTLGDVINSDTCDVHFEKAYTDINGAYPMVTREFARMLMKTRPEVIYLNREDDMGQESMRRAKESFQPEYLLKKYTARYLCE
jgi:hypothetical protein